MVIVILCLFFVLGCEIVLLGVVSAGVVVRKFGLFVFVCVFSRCKGGNGMLRFLCVC